MSFKDKIIEIIDSEAKSYLNQYYALYNAKTSNNGPQVGIFTGYDQEKGTLTQKLPNGTTKTGIQPGSAPVGPGVVGLTIGNQVIHN